MQQPNQPPRPASGAVVGAVLLIVIGAVALAVNLTGVGISGEAVPFGVGLAFLVAYALTRQYGFLVPGGIVSGFGGGVLAASLLGVADSDNGVYVVFGGALGFLLIYAVDFVVARTAARWWPLIPGGILLAVSSLLAAQGEGMVRQLGLWSPLVLVVIGVLMLIGRSRPVQR